MGLIAGCSIGTVRAQGAEGPAPTIPGATAVGIGLAAAATYSVSQNSQWKDYEDIAILGVLSGVAKAAATAGQPMTAPQYLNVATQVRAFLDNRRPANPVFADEAACLRYVINALVPIVSAPSLHPLVPGAIGRLERLKAARLEVPLDTSRDTPFDLATYTAAASAFPFIADLVHEASVLAHNDVRVAAALNPILVDLLGFDSTASYTQLKAAYPQAVPTLPAPNSDGSFTIAAQDLLAQFQAVMQDVASVTDAHLASLASQASAVSPQSSGLQAAAVSTPCTAGTPASADAVVIKANDCPSNPGKPDDYWKYTKAGVEALATLGNHVDPALGQQIATVGSAAIDAGKAIAKIAQVVKAGSIVSSLASFVGFATPVGALIGAGIEIFKAFRASSTPDPNAVILQAIQKLSQQVAELHADMTLRFDQVDAQLTVILGTLTSNFALINYQLGVVNGDIHAIQAGLLDVQAQLNHLQQYTLAYSQAQSKSFLITDMNGCLNYADVHNGADISPAKFGDCENAFYTWAHNDALNQLWAGLQQPSYADGDIYTTLSNFPISVTGNYLAQFPAQNLGLPALSGTRLANPNEWALGTRAYIQLAHEWPQYAAQINSARLADLIQIGTTLQLTAQNVNSSTAGTGITANHPLFAAALTKNAEAGTAVQSAVQGIVSNYTSNPANRLIGLSLWGGPGQATTYVPTGFSLTMPACDDSSKSYAVPPGLASRLSSVPRIAEQLGTGTLTLCLDFSRTSAFQAQGPSSIPIYLDTYTIRGIQTGEFVFLHRIHILETTLGGGLCGPDQVWNGFVSTCNGSGGLFSSGVNLITRVPLGPVSPDFTGVCFSLASQYSNPPPNSVPPAPLYRSLIDAGYYVCRLTSQAGFPRLNANSLAEIFTAGSDSLDSTTGLAVLSTNVNNALRSHQRSLYGQIASAFSSVNPLQSAGQLLSGAKLLMQGYVNVGLASSLKTSNALRGQLYGADRLFDASMLQGTFATLAASSIPDTTVNAITNTFAAVSARRANLSASLTAALNQIQQTQTRESLPEIDLLLDDLRAFKTLKDVGALSLCGYRLSSPGAQVGSLGATVRFTASTPSGCPVRPSSGSPWLHATAQPQSPGTVQITLAVDGNSTETARVGTLIVGDQLYRVVQAAGENGGGSAPAAFGKGGPTSGSTGTPLALTLSWSPSSGAASYEYCVDVTTSAGPHATCSTNWTTVGATTSVSLSGLSPTATYAWQVRAVNPSGVSESNTGSWWTFRTAPLPNPLTDLAIDFGPATGLWSYSPAGGAPVWQQLHHLSPSLLRTADLDGNGATDLVLDFTGYGLWAFLNNTTWMPLHPFDATDLSTGDLDGNGRDDVVVNFPGFGVWVRYDDATWRQLHSLNVTRMAVGNIDGTVGGKADVILTFPSQGLWAYRDNATWTLLHSMDTQDIQLGDLDGNGLGDVIVQFAGFGEWILYNSAHWAQLHSLPAAGIATGNLDGDSGGKHDLVINFPGAGVWVFLNNTTWLPLHGLNAPLLASGDIDGNGQADVILHFPGYGIWALTNLTTWLPIHSLAPKAVVSARVNGR